MSDDKLGAVGHGSGEPTLAWFLKVQDLLGVIVKLWIPDPLTVDSHEQRAVGPQREAWPRLHDALNQETLRLHLIFSLLAVTVQETCWHWHSYR